MGRAGPPHAAAADAQTAERAPGCRMQAAAPGGCRRAPRAAAPLRSRPARSLRRARSCWRPHPILTLTLAHRRRFTVTPPRRPRRTPRACARRAAGQALDGGARGARTQDAVHRLVRLQAVQQAAARGVPAVVLRRQRGARCGVLRGARKAVGPSAYTPCRRQSAMPEGQLRASAFQRAHSLRVETCSINTEAAERHGEPWAGVLLLGEGHHMRCCLLLRPSQYIQTAGEVPQTALK